MTILDKNKIFFALIHYILSEQKNVDWILKTSLIDFTGISSLLEEKAYKTDSILDDVVDYIVSVKPYHVQFSHYFEHYQTQSELAQIPKNDWIEQTYNLTFNNKSPEPDVKDIIIFNADATQEEIDEKLSSLVDGTYWIYYEKETYSRKSGLYDAKRVEQVDEWGDINLVSEITKTDVDAFINDSLANQLFYVVMKRYNIATPIRKGINDTKEKIFDEIKKDINANFKGIQINGAGFDVGKFGYDIFNYDTEDYDSPTIIYDYFIITNDVPELDETNEVFYITEGERVYNNPQYVTCDSQRFTIPSELQAYGESEVNEVYIVSPSGVISLYKSAEFGFDSETGNYVDIFRNIKLNEKIIVVNRQKNLTEDNKVVVNLAEVIIGVDFKESDSTTLRRQFVVYDELGMQMQLPSGLSGNNDKTVIQLKQRNGARENLLPTAYEVGDGYIIVNGDYVRPFQHIMMTSFDYKYLYDKIYTWEDKYALSNNVVNLYGDKFLRARYESDRPSELVVANPQPAVTIYKEEGKNYDVLMSDWKNEMTYSNNLKSALTTVEEVELEPDTLDKIVSIKFKKTNNFEDAPGKVLIGSEIIEYRELNKNTNVISSLERGVDGTPENAGFLPRYMPDKRTTIMPGDIALPIRKTDWAEHKKYNVYKSYQVEYLGQKDFICPTGFKIGSKVYITKNEKIDLMEDVYLNSTSIFLNSGNIVEPSVQKEIDENEGVYSVGNWTLKINEDFVKFEKIRKDANTGYYQLSELEFPLEYTKENVVIYSRDTASIFSSIPVDIQQSIDDNRDNDNFYVQIIEGDGELYMKQDCELPSEGTAIMDVYGYTDVGGKVFRIPSCKVDSEGNIVEYGTVVLHYTSVYDELTETWIENTEKMFGSIIDNKVYKNDGSLYAKLIDNKMVLVLVQVSFNQDKIILKKGESVNITVVDKEAIINGNVVLSNYEYEDLSE